MSKRTVLNFNPIIFFNWFKLSTSTVIFLPLPFFIASETKVLISELAIWLSLIKYSSLRLNLWFVPPPNLTAYFWITLRFGIVFLVQQILQFFPFILFTNWFVSVATPEIKPKKLRATLSLFKIALAFPFIIATTFPFFTFLPSLVFYLKLIFLSEYLKVFLA